MKDLYKVLVRPILGKDVIVQENMKALAAGDLAQKLRKDGLDCWFEKQD